MTKRKRKSKKRFISASLLWILFAGLALSTMAKPAEWTAIGGGRDASVSSVKFQGSEPEKKVTYAEYARSKGKLIYAICYHESYGCTYNGKCTWDPAKCDEWGVMQFRPGTWKDERCAGDFYNAFDQIDCAARMVKEGKAAQWMTLSKALAMVKN